MSEISLELKNIKKSFQEGEDVLESICLTAKKGEFVTLLGSSGCGKTTTLRIIAGLEQPDSGQVFLDGKDVTSLEPNQRNVNTVFQNYALFPHMNVADNIGYGLKLKKTSKAEISRRVKEMLELVQLPGFERRKPSELSGGQRQRVAFARALAPNPQLLLLDEPFAAIDAKVRQELRTWLKEMISKLGVTSIFVTHDQDEAIEVADEIIITNRGRIEQVGTPIEIYRHPQTSFTATFFGHTSVLADYQKYHTFQHMDGVEKAIVRPEFLKITKKNEVQKYGSSASQGVVERTSFRGDWIELEVRVNDDLLIAKRDLEEESVSVGETVDVFLYRLFVIVGEKCYLLENQSLQDDSVFI